MTIHRRKILQAGLVGGAWSVLRATGAARLAAAAVPAPAAPIFSDSFDSPTVAVKLAFTVLTDVEDGYRWLHTPSIIEGRKGTLIAAWSSNGLHGDEDPTNFLEVVRSTDNGATWSKPFPISTPSTIGPVFLRTKSGDPVLFCLRNHSLKQDDCSIVFRRTQDDGLTWGPEMPVDVGATVAIIVNNGLALPNGDWMISFHYDRAQQGDHFQVAAADYIAAVAVSSDEGKTWKRYDAAEIVNENRAPNTHGWAVEPAVALDASGILRMVIRSYNGYLYETSSRDLGKTWAPVKKTTFSNDNSKPSIVALSGGREVLLWNDTRVVDFQYRFPLIATLSEDDGKTWFRSLPIEDATVTLDYPSAVQTGESIKLVYGFDRRQMRFVDLHESDFKPWTAINNAGSWKAGDGILRYTGDRGGLLPETTPEWLHWSKVVCFLPAAAAGRTISVDFRFDETWAKDASIGVFAAYQDESNWTAWCWYPADGRAGWRQEIHSGSVTRPFYARNATTYALDHIEPPGLNNWYTLHATTLKDSISYRLIDRASGRELLAAAANLPWEGQSIALGSHKAIVSFDNVLVH